jgi:hypothetical protein
MFGSVAKPSNTEAVITKAGHGLSLPGTDKLMAIYIETGTGNFRPSDSTDTNKQKAVLVTEIIDVDTIRVQNTGFWRYTLHGYTIGNYYYVTDAGDGGFSTTPGTLNDVGFLVIDNNTLLLIDNREL